MILFMWMIVMTGSGEAKVLTETHTLPDSLLTEDHIYEYTFSDTVKATRIIDQMRQRKLASEHVLGIAQGDLLFDNGKYNETLSFYERALLAIRFAMTIRNI